MQSYIVRQRRTTFYIIYLFTAIFTAYIYLQQYITAYTNSYIITLSIDAVKYHSTVAQCMKIKLERNFWR